MPGHTPEERAKNDAARSIQPGPDRQGGSAVVSNDAGSKGADSKSLFNQWRTYLKKPEVVAGLLQFSAQMLQRNPGGFGPAFGKSVAAGLGAAGRFTKLQRELDERRAKSGSEAEQQDLENALDERRVATQEERTSILGRPRVGRGGGGKGDDEVNRQTTWENFFRGDPLPGEPVVDPGTVTRLGRAAVAAEVDIDGNFMAACQAIGNTSRSCAETYMDPQDRRSMKVATGLISIDGGKRTNDPETSKVVPGARTPSAVRGKDETLEAFATRKKEREVTEKTRVETLGAQDEIQRLKTDTANTQNQLAAFITEQIASGRRTEKEIAELIVIRNFTDKADLDFLLENYKGLWDLVTEKLANG